jgi:hypothetical protein
MISILAILTNAVRTTFCSSIETITIFFLTVWFCALTSFTFWGFFYIHLFPKELKSFRVELHIRTIQALTVFATEKLICKALAVKFQTLWLLTVALQFSLLLSRSRLGGLYRNKWIVFEHILKAAVATELYRIKLS